MKNSPGKWAYPLLWAALCGILSFAIDFAAIPLLCAGWPDPVWMALMVILPAALAAVLSAWTKPAAVWLGLPVQLILLIVFAQPICALLGISTGGLGGFAYLAQFIWPLVVTTVQFAVVWAVRRGKKNA